MIRREITASPRNRLFPGTGISRWKAAPDASAWFYDCGNQITWAAVAVSVLLFFYAVAYAFPHARLAAKQQEQEAIERESHAFCEKHGMPFGTREHTACVEDLMDIRANERQRALTDLGII